MRNTLSVIKDSTFYLQQGLHFTQVSVLFTLPFQINRGAFSTCHFYTQISNLVIRVHIAHLYGVQ